MKVLDLFSVALLMVTPSTPSPSRGVGEPARAVPARLVEYAHRFAREDNVVRETPIPGFSRQTGLPCSSCHSSFPQLNSFGRAFKLNGYTLTGLETVTAQDSGEVASLRLGLIPPISAMLISSVTSVRRDVPGVQNRSVAFPQELGLFVGGAITPKIGTFLQLTYDPAEGGIAVDNVDLRFADQAKLGGKPVLYGIDLNNSPTVQDVWNSTPVWGFPYTSSAVAPTPMASTLIDGGLGQAAVGLGAYALWNNVLYTELSVYRSAFQGGPVPVDETAENAIHGVSPYWRVALQRRFGQQQVMVGSYGLVSSLFPSGIERPRDRYRDVAFDAQIERPAPAGGSFTTHATVISENRRLNATVADGGADHLTGTLRTARIDATYYSAERMGGGLGFFSTTGSTDAALFEAEAVTGSASGSPKSQGFIAELAFMPWLNTRVGVQYVAYRRFNGSRLDYDGAGRNASDNNTLYLMTWLVF